MEKPFGVGRQSIWQKAIWTMRTAWAFTVMLLIPASVLGDDPPEVRLFEARVSRAPQTKIDRAVFGLLKRKGIEPAKPCTDAVFLRRVYLDVIGTLPTLEEAQQFLLSRNPNKRRLLIDQLLERDEFAEYWAMKWCDILRVKAEFPINLWPNAVQAYHRWIRDSIKNRMPYDQFVREILTSSGSNFRDPQVNFYRSMQKSEPKMIARMVALTFMGSRAENWPAARLDGMAAFFSRLGYKRTAEWKEEIVFFDSLGTEPIAPGTAIFPNGMSADIADHEDPRAVFANWLVDAENPWFTRNIVNRVWYWLMGRGIIHEPDDIRPDNEPINPRLLEVLEHQLMAADYDLRALYRLILNSRTYQLSSIPPSEDQQAAACFAYYPLRQLDAEVLIDAICQITGTTEEYSSNIPEPFTFIPGHQRSITLADGSITSSFLEMFGRPPRDTGLVSERINRTSDAQRLHLLNSSHIQKKIQRSEKLRELWQSSKNQNEVVARIYLVVLSRLPTPQEIQVIQQYAKFEEVSRSEALVDLTWALINSVEFLCRH